MQEQAETTIGGAMALIATMLGLKPADIQGFVVIVDTNGTEGYLLHNSQTYLNLIATLLYRAQTLIREMDVDQVINFGQIDGT